MSAKKILDEIEAKEKLRARGYKWIPCERCIGLGNVCLHCNGDGGHWEAPLTCKKGGSAPKRPEGERILRDDEEQFSDAFHGYDPATPAHEKGPEVPSASEVEAQHIREEMLRRLDNIRSEVEAMTPEDRDRWRADNLRHAEEAAKAGAPKGEEK